MITKTDYPPTGILACASRLGVRRSLNVVIFAPCCSTANHYARTSTARFSPASTTMGFAASPASPSSSLCISSKANSRRVLPACTQSGCARSLFPNRSGPEGRTRVRNLASLSRRTKAPFSNSILACTRDTEVSFNLNSVPRCRPIFSTASAMPPGEKTQRSPCGRSRSSPWLFGTARTMNGGVTNGKFVSNNTGSESGLVVSWNVAGNSVRQISQPGGLKDKANAPACSIRFSTE
mmetsp:Transcript_90895/g.231335  ORF Transcript_90895/g.231335 Transcript_90895/m.231335 type:complete len:236 (-) Transcript_90895:869-1576(-)